MNTRPLPFKLIGQYDKQKFNQVNPESTSNWYQIRSKNGKSEVVFFPTAGRKHVNILNSNRLIFNTTPRGIFRTKNYMYIVDGKSIIRYDDNFNQTKIDGGNVTTQVENVYFDKLVAGNITFACFTDGQNMYVYREDTQVFSVVADTKLITAGVRPQYIAVFGNRVVISDVNSARFYLSKVNLNGSLFSETSCFQDSAGNLVFAQESDVIGQFGVLHNTLYIFTDTTTGIWSDIRSVFSGSGDSFPFKKNTTYEWDYGITQPNTLDIGFGMMVWLGRTKGGIPQVLVSEGDRPKVLSTDAIDLLFQRDANNNEASPFNNFRADGFLFQQDNTRLYRLSAGLFHNYDVVDVEIKASSIEYNFSVDEWHTCIEANGARNRVQKHVNFNDMDLVTILNDTTVYEMSGQYYVNEITNPDRVSAQSTDAYLQHPFRYERITPIIRENDDAEFNTEWVQIDFVFGKDTFVNSTRPFENAVFIIDEDADQSGDPVYITDEDGNYLVTEGSDYPVLNEKIYNDLFKPHIELYFSDDGGMSFNPADVREFSEIGRYRWRMRWYELGASRNRVYKLVCVSPAAIVVISGLMLTKRISGGGF